MMSYFYQLKCRKMITMYRFLVVLLCAMASPVSANVDVLLKTIVGSTIEGQTSESNKRYALPLAAMIKVNSNWQVKKQLAVQGDLTRTTYKMAQGVKAADAIGHYQQLFALYQSTTLFRCESRDCGSSNQWGNGFFNNKRLVANDRDQYYQALEIIVGERRYYAALYVVEQVSDQVYVHLDWLAQSVSGNESEESRLARANLRHNGRLVISADILSSTQLQEQLNAVLGFIQEAPQPYSVYIVGHAYGDIGYTLLYQKSLGYAKVVSEALFNLADQSAVKTEVHGVGPLAPAGRSADAIDRVEIVLFRR
jgi:hypothetical protein